MVAATVHIREANGGTDGSPVMTDNVADLDMGSVGTTGLDPVANPITAGNNSYEKWFKIEMHAKNDSTQIQNYKVWSSGNAVPANCTWYHNLHETSGWVNSSYVVPVATNSTVADHQPFPTAEPSTTNVGRGGTLGAACTVDLDTTDYIVMQMRTTAAATAGTTLTITFKYEEVA